MKSVWACQVHQRAPRAHQHREGTYFLWEGASSARARPPRRSHDFHCLRSHCTTDTDHWVLQLLQLLAPWPMDTNYPCVWLTEHYLGHSRLGSRLVYFGVMFVARHLLRSAWIHRIPRVADIVIVVTFLHLLGRDQFFLFDLCYPVVKVISQLEEPWRTRVWAGRSPSTTAPVPPGSPSGPKCQVTPRLMTPRPKAARRHCKLGMTHIKVR